VSTDLRQSESRSSEHSAEEVKTEESESRRSKHSARSEAKVEEEARRSGEGRAKAEVASTEKIRRRKK
jgi:hypothetical protein